jgi:phage replication initiation protein
MKSTIPLLSCNPFTADLFSVVPSSDLLSAKSTPPSCNTGVENTECVVSGVKLLVDWVSLTDKSGALRPGELLPNFPEAEWVEGERGGYGYKRSLHQGHAAIYFDGSAGMGQHIVLSGQGCRELEAAGLTDWSGLMAYWADIGLTRKRLDVAFDDRAGILDLRAMKEQLVRGDATSRFKRRGTYESGPAVGPDDSGYTVQLGQRSSDVHVRMYDKAAEQAAKRTSSSDTPADEHWVRIEMELHGERAEAAAIALSKPDGAAVIAGVLRGYIDFKDRSESDENKARWATSAFWLRFLGAAAKCRLDVEPEEHTLEKSGKWFRSACTATMAMLLLGAGGDLAFVDALLAEGKRKMKPKHFAMLAVA